MATDRANHLRAFREYIDEQLTNGGAEMTVDEALIHWEAEHQTDEEKEDTLRAIKQGFSDIAAGRTRPYEEFDRRVSGPNMVCPHGNELSNLAGFRKKFGACFLAHHKAALIERCF